MQPLTSHMTPIIMNALNPITGLYNHIASYDTPQLQNKDIVDLQTLQIRDIYNNFGYINSNDLQNNSYISTGTYNFTYATGEIEANMYDYNYIITKLNAIAGTPFTFSAVVDSDTGKFQYFNVQANINTYLGASGNYAHLLGIHQFIKLTSGVPVRLENDNVYRIQYIKLVCPNLDGAMQIMQQNQSYYSSGTLHIMFPQGQSAWGSHDRGYSFNCIKPGRFEMRLLDQDDQPVRITQFYSQVIIRNFNESDEQHEKRLAFIMFGPMWQNSATQALSRQLQVYPSHQTNFKYIALQTIYAYLPTPPDVNVSGVDILVQCETMCDAGCPSPGTMPSPFVQLISYENSTSAQNRAQFTWRPLTQSSMINFNVDEILLHNQYIHPIYVNHIYGPSQTIQNEYTEQTYTTPSSVQNCNIIMRVYLK